MLIDAKQSALLVVDVQGRLVPAIAGWQTLLDQVIWLIRVERRMEIPVLAEAAGTVTEVNVAVGDVIQAGHLIAVID
jgi:multidrug efflux pump subunit AcrA (membrane-fusion protein)